MSREVFVITGLAIGEETKGATVQAVAAKTDAHTVWRHGGSQAGHFIVLSDGREQMFSHFASGTFEGAQTYLKHMVINPVDLYTEGRELEKKGVTDVFSRIVISDDCLTTTPFHSAMSRFREILRGKNKKGTIGKGVGEAIRDSKNPDLAIYAGEFTQDPEVLLEKVERIRNHKLQQAKELIEDLGITELPEAAKAELEILEMEDLGETIVESFAALAKLVRIVNETYLDTLLQKDGTIVTEPSHGALLHPRYGFVPHVTQVDPTGQDVLQTLRDRNYDGKVVRLGVSRCYMTRHGAGPLVSQSKEMTTSIHETHNNAYPAANEWLGEFRNGNYDIVALKYALEISGGKENFDGLGISYLDVLNKHSEWQVCEAYTFQGKADDLEKYFVLDDDKIVGIKKHPDTGDDDTKHYEHQLRLTELLKECQPILTTLKPTADQTLEQVFLAYVQEKLGLPVVMVAHGPTKEDRTFLDQNYIL